MEDSMRCGVYVIDTKGGRRWEEILPTGTTPCDFNVLTGIAPCPTAGDVLVFHDEKGDVRDAVAELAQSGVWVIAVDLGGGMGLDRSGRFYHRKRGVGKPIDDDFKTCFARFLTHLQEHGTPDWRLIEGPPAPDALLAYHFLSLLSADPGAREKQRELRPTALNEAKAISGEDLDDSKLDDPAWLRELLRRC